MLSFSPFFLMVIVVLGQECDIETTPCRKDIELCVISCAELGKCEINVVVILPHGINHGNTISLSSVIPELKRSVQDAYFTNLIPDWLHVNFIEKDDMCSETYAQLAVIEAFTNDTCPHVILGPMCEYAVATVARVVKFYGTPLLGPGGLSLDFERPKKSCDDDYFLFVRTSSLFNKGISSFVKSLFLKYNWKKIVFLYHPDGQSEVAGPRTCSFFMQSLILSLRDIENLLYVDGDISLSTMNISEYMKAQIGVDYAIIVTCVSYQMIREILLAASSLGNMISSGEYVFFNVELTQQAEIPDKPWIDTNYTKENNEKLKAAYRSVITLTSKTSDNVENSHPFPKTQSKFISDFYNSMQLYLTALSTFINKTNNFTTSSVNGYEIVREIYGNTFVGKNNETIEINCEGSRNNEYSLFNYNPHKNKFEVVANYEEKLNLVKFIPGKKIYWPGGHLEPPLDTPKCGYNNSKCPIYVLPTYVFISIGLIIAAILLCVITVIIYRRHKLEADILSMSWKVAWEDIIDLQSLSTRRDSLSSSVKRGSQLTFASDLFSLAGDNQIFIPIGLYKNNKVAIKKLAPIKIEFSRNELFRLKQMKDLQHDHLTKFHGACVDAPNFCILSEYCSKGSLQDILENDNLTLEWMIRISLIQDLVRGMAYLHQSEIKSHGSLSSTNCVVDSRFVLKITDFGLPFFPRLDTPKEETYAYWRKKLWTAPELLRVSNPAVEGTQKGDVYSFAIVVHEIVVREGLFYLGEGVQKTPKDIVCAIKNYVPSEECILLRPYIDYANVDEEIINLIQKCWSEDPMDRPEFVAIKNTLKKINKENDNRNILDNLLSRMEQYANNLETLVEERTADYLEEKRKCEELLYQLLPKSVAAQLIRGQSVIAETFEEVTIYFSDIVGFTSLSAASTPLQVVDLLNDLYTCFDSIVENFDVYKVETIGDAYMVVSGLPVRNGNLHSREIARMSLSLLAAVDKFQIRHRPDEKLKLRIGLHTGPCVAGVVGLKMPRYCLFGDTVNTASRMESNGEALRIHISPFTKHALDQFGSFDIQKRGEVELKGKGKMVTYWLNGENQKPLNNEQPNPINLELPINNIPLQIDNEINVNKNCLQYPKSPYPIKNSVDNKINKSNLKLSKKNKVTFKNNITTKFNDNTIKSIPLISYTQIK